MVHKTQTPHITEKPENDLLRWKHILKTTHYYCLYNKRNNNNNNNNNNGSINVQQPTLLFKYTFTVFQSLVF